MAWKKTRGKTTAKMGRQYQRDFSLLLNIRGD
jgi:hypothetical protein